MKKATFFTKKVLVGLSLILLFVACTKEQLPTPTNSPIIQKQTTTISDGEERKSGSRSSSLSATDILDKSILRWNKYFGYSVQGISSQYIGEITNESNRQSIVAAITNESAWAPYGNTAHPKSVSARKLKYSTYSSFEPFPSYRFFIRSGTLSL